jgi:hypothetical protein
MARQYPLNEPLSVVSDLVLTELPVSLQLLHSEVPQPNPTPRYAVWVYRRARGRSNVAPAAVRQNSAFT